MSVDPAAAPAQHDVNELLRELHELTGESGAFDYALARIAEVLRADRFQFRVTSRAGVVVDEILLGGSVLAEMVPTDGAVRSHVFIEAATKMVRFAVSTSFSVGAGECGSLVLARSALQAQFTDDERALLRGLTPHLATVRRNAQRMRTAYSDARALRAALDTLPGAVAIIDGDLRVTSANELAVELLGRTDPVRLEQGKLVGSRAMATALSSEVASVLRDVVAGNVSPTRTVSIPRSGEAPLSIVLTPLGTGAKRRGSRLLAIFSTPDRVVHVDPARVASLHGLTKVEADLAAALVEGLTVTEFAERRGCTEQTARTHLKRTLEKTGTNRQTDLVRKLLADLATHRPR